MDLVIRGTIVMPNALLEGGWVAVAEGKIAAIGDAMTVQPEAKQTVDYADCLVMPGVIDGQTHATSAKGLPGIADTTLSAIAGGVTTLVDMPFDNPEPLDRPERLREKYDAIDTYSHADMALYGSVTHQTGVRHIEELIEGGVVAFKISSFESDPIRFPRIGADLMLDIMEKLAKTHIPLGLHNEDQEIVRQRMARLRSSGEDGIAAHSTSRPLAAELSATAHFLALAQATGAHAHPVHLTSSEGFEIIDAFEKMAVRATGETCVHYLWFDVARDGNRLGARMKVNPPIRAGEIDALWQAIVDGKVAFTSSDHSSWPIDGKLTQSIFDAGAGVPGLETLLPAFFTAAQARGLDAARLTASQLSERPAVFFGLSDRKGAIRVGNDADFAILEKGAFEWDEAGAHDGLNWSPFTGETFTVRLTATYLRGIAAFKEGAPTTPTGHGRYVKRGKDAWFIN